MLGSAFGARDEVGGVVFCILNAEPNTVVGIGQDGVCCGSFAVELAAVLDSTFGAGDEIGGVVFGVLNAESDTVIRVGQDRVSSCAFAVELTTGFRDGWNGGAAFGAGDQGGGVVFGILNAVTDAVVCVGQDGVGSGTLAVELGDGNSKDLGGEEEDGSGGSLGELHFEDGDLEGVLVIE